MRTLQNPQCRVGSPHSHSYSIGFRNVWSVSFSKKRLTPSSSSFPVAGPAPVGRFGLHGEPVDRGAVAEVALRHGDSALYYLEVARLYVGSLRVSAV